MRWYIMENKVFPKRDNSGFRESESDIEIICTFVTGYVGICTE
jgi:hypothetical protein